MRTEGNALSMVTPRNFGREVVLRRDPSSSSVGCQRTSIELLVKDAILRLLALRVNLRRQFHSATFVIASCMAASAISLLEWLLKSEDILGKHDRLHVFGYDSPKVFDVQ